MAAFAECAAEGGFVRDPAQIRMLADGRRLHLHDGPMDLIVEAFGAAECVHAAYRAAATRFVGLLDELCGELPMLRQRACVGAALPSGVVARRMFEAVAPFGNSVFITPMAAVAGAVAEEILAAMTDAAPISRAYVNDGGDIAIHLTPAEQFDAALIDWPDASSLFAKAKIRFEDSVRGIATSGWRGRSFSLGIADAVTILAPTAAMADASATIVANAVDLPGHPAIMRIPAREISPDSDLRDIPVTRGVGRLHREEITEALERGLCRAKELQNAGLICAAALHLQGETVSAGITPAFRNQFPSELAVSPERGRIHA